MPSLPFPTGLPCPLQATTGLDCPLCGATRATVALVRGDLLAALDFNLLYVALLPAAALLGGWWLIRRRPPAIVQASWFPKAAIVVAVAYMVVRNLPFAPFDYLST